MQILFKLAITVANINLAKILFLNLDSEREVFIVSNSYIMINTPPLN